MVSTSRQLDGFLCYAPSVQQLESQSFHIPSATASAEDAKDAEELQKSLHGFIKGVSGQKREALIHHIQEMREKISSTISAMKLSGQSTEEIRKKVRSMYQELRSTSEKFCDGCEKWCDARVELARGLSEFDAKIKNSKPRVTLRDRSTDAHSHSHDSEKDKDASSHGIAHTAIEIGHGFGMHKLEHFVPKTPSVLIDLLSKVLLNSEHHHRNPWRDSVISAGTTIAIAEAISHVKYCSLPVFAIVAGAEVAALGAHYVKPYVDRLEQDTRMPLLWEHHSSLTAEDGISYQGAIGASQLALKIAPVPAEILHAIHRKITDRLCEFGDQLGITDATIAQIAKRSIEFIAKHSSEDQWNKFIG